MSMCHPELYSPSQKKSNNNNDNNNSEARGPSPEK